MIHGVFGKLGAGKGVYVMDVIADELMKGTRSVVTNVPLRLDPWVNGQGKPQIGFKAYMKGKGIDEFDWGRVKVVESVDDLWDLFMHRRDGETGEWFKMSSTHADEKGKPDRFDPNEALARKCQPNLIVTDEAWICYPNNGGWSRAPLIPFYARQSRKLRDEWYIVTQHPTDVDSVIWNITQDFIVCRNHGMERMGIFRQPAMFRTITYLTNPAKGSAIRSHESYKRLDAAGLCQCYDTTAGVGFSGGFAGDAGQKRKGVHMGWLIGVIVLGVAVLALVPKYLGSGAAKYLGGQMEVKDGVAWAGLKKTNVVATAAVGAAVGAAVVPAVDGAPKETTASDLYCVGYFVNGKAVSVFMSDGETIASESGRVTQVTKTSVVVDGLRYPVRMAVKPSAASSPVWGVGSR